MNDTNVAGGAAVSIVILSRCIARIQLLHQLVTIQWQWYVLLADISLQYLRLCVSDSSEYCQHKNTILQQKLLWVLFKQFVGDTDTIFQSMDNAVYVYLHGLLLDTLKFHTNFCFLSV